MIHAWGTTDRGAVRVQNQDSYYLALRTDDLVIAIVCDGMGGASAGNVASALAVEYSKAYLEQLSVEELLERPGDHMSEAAERSNDVIFHRANHDPNCRGMGTTMVAAVVHSEKAYILNIGDSRAYHINQSGIKKVTRDHSVVEALVQRGEITPEEARTHPQKNLITRAMGSEHQCRSDLYEEKLERGDYLLLCSDGLSNMVTDQEMLFEVIHGGDASGCCQRLLDIAMSRGAPDNVTVILIQIL